LKIPLDKENSLISARREGFRLLRTSLLLIVLLLVAVVTWRDRVHSTSWRVPLYVAIYPIPADDSEKSAAYVNALDAGRFDPVDRFFAGEGRRFGLQLDAPVKTRLHSPLNERPPERAAEAGILSTVLWSLKLRYWAWRITRGSDDPADVRMFVLYHDPDLSPRVPHSLGLQKGLIGVVYAFADGRMDGGNNMVIAHELMHTLGATDKYDLATDAPRFPDGYGDPAQIPLYPQKKAELMGGRRMLSATGWEQPESLADVVIGPSSALEIRWLLHAH
jgi:hypothetical protein